MEGRFGVLVRLLTAVGSIFPSRAVFLSSNVEEVGQWVLLGPVHKQSHVNYNELDFSSSQLARISLAEFDSKLILI